MEGKGRLFLGLEGVIWGWVSERWSDGAEERGRACFLARCLGMVRSPSLMTDEFDLGFRLREILRVPSLPFADFTSASR